MKNNIKKVLVIGCVAICAMVGVAAPYHGGYYGYNAAPVHHYHNLGFWGPEAQNCGAGFIGGVVGGAIINNTYRYPTVVTTPVVTTPVVTTPVVTTPVVTTPIVTTPVVTTPVVQTVFVEGRYVDQVQANGSIVRTWVPRHFEQRTIVP